MKIIYLVVILAIAASAFGFRATNKLHTKSQTKQYDDCETDYLDEETWNEMAWAV